MARIAIGMENTGIKKIETTRADTQNAEASIFTLLQVHFKYVI